MEKPSRVEKLRSIIEISLNPNQAAEVIIKRHDALQKNIYYNTHFRKFLLSSCLDLNFLSSMNLSLKTWFQNKKWMPILGLDDKIYSSLVYDFYKTLHAKSVGVFGVRVKGQELILTDVLLGNIWNIPCIGKRISKFDHAINFPNFDFFGFVRKIFNLKNDESVPYVLRRSQLEPSLQILHYLITKILVPNRCNLGTMSMLDTFFMCNISHFIKVNLPYVILEHMTSLKSPDELPYAMLLTSSFRHFNIDLSGERNFGPFQCILRQSILKVLKRGKTPPEIKIMLDSLFEHVIQNDVFETFSESENKVHVLCSLVLSNSSSSCCINSKYINHELLKNIKGKSKVGQESNSSVDDIPMTAEEMKFLENISESLVQSSGDPAFGLREPHNSGTSLFFSHFNLQSRMFNTIEQNPHLEYLKTPLQTQEIPLMIDHTTLSHDLLTSISQIDEHSEKLHNTAYSLGASHRYVSDIMSEAKETRTRLKEKEAHQDFSLEHILKSLDSIGKYFQCHCAKTEVAMRNINSKLDEHKEKIDSLIHL